MLKFLVENDVTKICDEPNSNWIRFIDDELSVKDPSCYFNPSFTAGYWDGKIRFLDKKTNTFPTGLLSKVLEVIDVPFEIEQNFKVFDIKLPKKISLIDKKSSDGKLVLRYYQYNSVKNALEQKRGIVNVATNGGKCLTKDSLILTADGYKPLEQIFSENGTPCEDKQEAVPARVPLINSHGLIEYTKYLTFNGKKPVKKITTKFGLELKATYNHPLLALSDKGTVFWKRMEDIKVGDLILTQFGENIFGSDTTIKTLNEAYHFGIRVRNSNKIPQFILNSSKGIQVSFLLGYFEKNLMVYPKDKYIELFLPSKEVSLQMLLILRNLGVKSKVDKENKLYVDKVKIINLFSLLNSEEFLPFEIEGLEDYELGIEEFCMFGKRLVEKVTEVEEIGEVETFDFSMSYSHSFIANGIVNHNTEVAAGISKVLLPKLKKDKRILFFTHSKEIATQSAERLSERLGMEIGMIGNGKWIEEPITVVMIPTVSRHIKEPKITENCYTKEMKSIRFLLKFLGDVIVEDNSENKKIIIDAIMVLQEVPEDNYDQKAIDILSDLLSFEKKEKGIFRAFNKLYDKLAEFENKVLQEKTEKHEKVLKLLNSAVCFIADECHHSSSSTWFDTLMLCKNASYRIGLTGTVDKSKPINTMKLIGVTGEIISKVSNEFLINKGFSAKPIIYLEAIPEPVLPNDLEYMEAYEHGIVDNKYRNSVISEKVEEKYNMGKHCLIIVSRKKHGENIAKLLEEKGIEYEYVHGSRSLEDRQGALDGMKEGKLKVLISTNILDEGVDISNIDTVFMAGGGKSFRQILQRVGRALRVKKDRENICEIYDYLDYTNRYLTIHSKERYKYYKDEKFEIRRG